MGIRFRKSIKVAPGVRVNIGKKSVGVSVGVKGFKKSINSSGRVTTTISVPGTGISYVSTKNMNSNKNQASVKDTATPASTTASDYIDVPGTDTSYVSTKDMNSNKNQASVKHTAAPASTTASDYSSTTPAAAPVAPLNCSRTVASLLCIFLGYFGAHYFYARRWGMGLLYFCTVGLFCIGWLVDIFRIFAGRFCDKYGEII